MADRNGVHLSSWWLLRLLLTVLIVVSRSLERGEVMSAYCVQDKLLECQMLVAGHADLQAGSVPVCSPDMNDKSKYIVATGTSGATPKNRVSRN